MELTTVNPETDSGTTGTTEARDQPSLLQHFAVSATRRAGNRRGRPGDVPGQGVPRDAGQDRRPAGAGSACQPVSSLGGGTAAHRRYRGREVYVLESYYQVPRERVAELIRAVITFRPWWSGTNSFSFARWRCTRCTGWTSPRRISWPAPRSPSWGCRLVRQGHRSDVHRRPRRPEQPQRTVTRSQSGHAYRWPARVAHSRPSGHPWSRAEREQGDAGRAIRARR
jgi:hypothetical protein